MKTLSIILIFLFSQICNANDEDRTELYIKALLFLNFSRIQETKPNPPFTEKQLELLAEASAKSNTLNFHDALFKHNVSLETVKTHLAFLAATEYNRLVQKKRQVHQIMEQFRWQPSQTEEYYHWPSNQTEEYYHWPSNQTEEHPPHQLPRTEERPSCQFSNNKPLLEESQGVFLKPQVPFWHQYPNNSAKKDQDLLISGDNLWDNA